MTAVGAASASEVFMGLGGTVDWELVWNLDRLQARVDAYGIALADLDVAIPVTDERSLLIRVLSHMAEGVGGECFVDPATAMTGFARQFGYQVTLGGTNIRAAAALQILGIPSTVYVVAIDPTMRRLLPVSAKEIHAYEVNELVPHLIVLYPPRARVTLRDGQIETTRANRLIFANDPPNREMTLTPAISRAVSAAKVTVLSTLNVIQDADVLEERLKTVAGALSSRQKDSWTIWEDAGYHNPAFALRVRDVLAPLVDVFSLNEDELQWYVGHKVELLDAGAVSNALDELRQAIRARNLIVHSKDWALAVGADAEVLRSAVASGVQMASTRFEFGDAMTLEEFNRVGVGVLEPEAVEFCSELETLRPDVSTVPSFAIEVPYPTTIGLGDAFVGGVVAALNSIPSPGSTSERGPIHEKELQV